jgi:hypothetical protein
MRQGTKVERPPWAVRTDWNIDEVVSLGTSAVGDGIEWLRHRRPDAKLLKGESRSDSGGGETYILVGQLLTTYVAAAAKLAKEAREALSDKNLKKVTEKELRELLVAEVRRDPTLRAAVAVAIAETRAGMT